MVDEVVDQGWPRIDPRLPILQVVELVERFAPEGMQAEMELQQDVRLALEVVVERGLRGPEPLGYVAQGGLVIALLGEEFERNVKNPLACGRGRFRCGSRSRWSGRAGRMLCRPSGHVHSLLDDRQVVCMIEHLASRPVRSVGCRAPR